MTDDGRLQSSSSADSLAELKHTQTKVDNITDEPIQQITCLKLVFALVW